MRITVNVWHRSVQVCAWIALVAVLFPAVAQARPNILFIFTDDHAPHAIGAYGSKINETPNIDRLAREGMLFRNSFCTNSICGPSRAVILTGKHSHLNGFRTNRDRFDGSQQTFPKLLQKAGYQTAIVGKWHLKTEPTGFDFWKVLQGQGPYYNPPLRTPDGVERHTGYTTDIITDITLQWLEKERDKDRPFLLMSQHKAPHREWAPGPDHLTLYDDREIPEPATLFDDYATRTSATHTQTMTIARHLNQRDLKFVPPRNLTPEQLEKWNAAYGPKNRAFEEAKLEGKELVRWKYQRYIKDYLRCIASVDDNIGRLLAYLDKSGLAENTIVIYSSDQGFYLGDHGWFDKRWMYEESLKMPLVVRWPGVVKPGSVNEDLVQNLDYAETFLDIAGAPIPDDMQGRSLVPLLEGESPDDWRKSIYYHYYEFPGAHSVRRHLGVRTQRYKLINYYNLYEWELFDLEKDPDELRNIYDRRNMQGTVKELYLELERLQKLYGDTEPRASLSAIERRQLERRARRVKLQRVLHMEEGKPASRSDLDPSGKPITVGARCVLRSGDGVVVAQGGESLGYSLYFEDARPRFAVRNQGQLRVVKLDEAVPLSEPIHVAGILFPDGKLSLLVDGDVKVSAPGHLIRSKPADDLTVAADTGSLVADYSEPLPFQGTIRDLRIYWGVLDAEALRKWARAGSDAGRF